MFESASHNIDETDIDVICECGENFKSTTEFEKHFEDVHRDKPSGAELELERQKKEVTVYNPETKKNTQNRRVIVLPPNTNINVQKRSQPQSKHNAKGTHLPKYYIGQKLIVYEQPEVIFQTELKTKPKISQDQDYYRKFIINKQSEPKKVFKIKQESETEKTEDDFIAYKCSVCEKLFMNQKLCHSHIKKEHEMPIKYEKTICEVCGKKYSSAAALRYHTRVHTGEKPYACPVCPKRFTMTFFLQIHMRTHTGDKPYECKKCPKAFTNKAALMRHDRVHTGVKPYACPRCGKCFTQSNSMKLHVRTVHLKEPSPYKSKARKRKLAEKTLKLSKMRNDNENEKSVKIIGSFVSAHNYNDNIKIEKPDLGSEDTDFAIQDVERELEQVVIDRNVIESQFQTYDSVVKLEVLDEDGQHPHEGEDVLYELVQVGSDFKLKPINSNTARQIQILQTNDVNQ